MKVEINITEANPILFNSKIKMLEELAQLDNSILTKLVELRRSKKATEYISKPINWAFIKRMVM